MARLQNALSSDVAKGVLIGAGLVLLVPLALTLATGAGRPALRRAVKTGMRLLEKGRETLAETSEVVEDLVAEVQAELREERTAGAAGVKGEGAAGGVADAAE